MGVQVAINFRGIAVPSAYIRANQEGSDWSNEASPFFQSPILVYASVAAFQAGDPPLYCNKIPYTPITFPIASVADYRVQVDTAVLAMPEYAGGVIVPDPPPPAPLVP